MDASSLYFEQYCHHLVLQTTVGYGTYYESTIPNWHNLMIIYFVQILSQNNGQIIFRIFKHVHLAR